MNKEIKVADLYCGAGGSSSGLFRAAQARGLKVDLVAINHWKAAIATHSKNHPWARHLQTSINSVDPREVVPSGHLHILWASPECVHFSQARGGKPVNPQSRASGWHILHWAETLRIDNIIIENVKEFRSWGPLKRVLRFNKKLGRNHRVWVPDPKRKGETYQAFLAALRSLNYNVEERVLNAADYGDPTTRERLYIIARRGQRKIQWPEPSHTRSDNRRLFGSRKKWRAAREIIDFTIPGKSIFNRKKPLAPATIARIMSGLEKFGGKELQPFLVVMRNHADAQSLDKPVPALTAGGNHMGIAEPRPFQVIMRGKSKVRSIDEPTPTSSTTGAHLGVAEPFIVPNNNNNQPKSMDDPVPTITTGNRLFLSEPFILGHRQFNENCIDSIERPLRTITAKGGSDMGVVQPFIVPQFGEREGQAPRHHSIDEPLPAVTSHGAGAVVEPVLVTVNHGNGDEGTNANKRRAHNINDPVPGITGSPSLAVAEPCLMHLTHGGRIHDIDKPVPTITTAKRGEIGLINPLVAKYYGTGQCRPIDEPLDTITAKDRFGLVMPIVNGMALDIRFRMLQPKELAAAMGFDPDYQFEGNREQIVKQIGNAVCVNVAQALCGAVLG